MSDKKDAIPQVPEDRDDLAREIYEIWLCELQGPEIITIEDDGEDIYIWYGEMGNEGDGLGIQYLGGAVAMGEGKTFVEAINDSIEYVWDNHYNYIGKNVWKQIQDICEGTTV